MSQRNIEIVADSNSKSHLVTIYTRFSLDILDDKFNEITGEYLKFPRYCSIRSEEGTSSERGYILAVVTDRAYWILFDLGMFNRNKGIREVDFIIADYHIKEGDGSIRNSLLARLENKDSTRIFVPIPSHIGYDDALKTLIGILKSCRQHGLLSHSYEVKIEGDQETGEHKGRGIIKMDNQTSLEERITIFTILRGMDWGFETEEENDSIILCSWYHKKADPTVINATNHTLTKTQTQKKGAKRATRKPQDDESEELCSSPSSEEPIPTFKSTVEKSIKVETNDGQKSIKKPNLKTVHDLEKDIFTPTKPAPHAKSTGEAVPPSQSHIMQAPMVNPMMKMQEDILKAKAEMDGAYMRMMNATEEFQRAKERFMSISFSIYPANHMLQAPQSFQVPTPVETPFFHGGMPVVPLQGVQKFRVKNDTCPQQLTEENHN